MAKQSFRLLLVLWVGSLWSTVWVALTIFYAQPDRHLAGVIAARLFSIETYLGLACAVFAAAVGQQARFRLGFVAAGLLVINEWALKPLMERALSQGSALGLSFAPWHGLSALLYLGACVCALVLIKNKDVLYFT